MALTVTYADLKYVCYDFRFYQHLKQSNHLTLKVGIDFVTII